MGTTTATAAAEASAFPLEFVSLIMDPLARLKKLLVTAAIRQKATIAEKGFAAQRRSAFDKKPGTTASRASTDERKTKQNAKNDKRTTEKRTKTPNERTILRRPMKRTRSRTEQ